MNFGIFAEFLIREGRTQTEAFEEGLGLVEEAEKLGIDSIWLAEYHFSPERSVLAAPLIVASAIAARTSRVRVGLAVQVLPLSNPLRLAEEAATVDQISKGRFDFGIGRSGLTKYYEGYNVPYSQSRPRFLEALDVILTAWNGESFSYEGEYYTYRDVTLVPKPYQKPHPPIWVAVASPETYPAMGNQGHAIFVSAVTPMPVLRERVSEYRKARREAGHSGPDKVFLRIPAYVAETREKARSEPKASVMYQMRYTAEELLPTAASEQVAENLRRMASASYDEILRDRVINGSPEEVVERIQQYKEELGISGVVLEVNYGGRIPNDRVVESVRLLCEKVMPRFK